MAQTVIINLTAGKVAVDAPKAGHTGGRGSSASGDLTVSFDPATVKSISNLKQMLQTAVLLAAGGKELIP